MSSYYLEVMRGERHGRWPWVLHGVARVGAAGYGQAVRLRRTAYARGWLDRKRLPRPTVCVGNITAGGTGKTPAVIAAVETLKAMGHKPVILSRGYGRTSNGKGPVIVSNGREVAASPQEAGDEPYFLATRLTGVPVVVGGDRYAAGQAALEAFPVDVFVLDDGFQHWALERDLDIVLVDATDPFGGGRYLPAGFLREDPRALQRAGLMILTRTDLVDASTRERVRAAVRSYARPDTPLLLSVHLPVSLRALETSEVRPAEWLSGKKAVAISGLGHPAAFERTLQKLGAEVVQKIRFGDHAGTAEEVLRQLRPEANDVVCVTTSKDRSRLRGLPGAWALEIEFRIVEGQSLWRGALSRLFS